MGGTEIAQQCLYRNPFVILLGSISVDDEIDHGKEGVAIDVPLLAYLLDRLVPESQTDAEGTQALQHSVIVADKVYHLVPGFI